MDTQSSEETYKLPAFSSYEMRERVAAHLTTLSTRMERVPGTNIPTTEQLRFLATLSLVENGMIINHQRRITNGEDI